MHSVSHNAGSLWTQFITFLGVKSSFFHSVFSHNYVTVSTNNIIRNENPASTGSSLRWMARNGFFFYILYIPFV